MKLLSWLIALPVGAVAVLFAISNLHRVAISLWPIPYEVTVPLFLIGLVALAAGIVVGGLIAWLGQGGWRRRARRAESRLAKTQRDLETAQREREQYREELQRQRKSETVHAEPVAPGAATGPRQIAAGR